MKRVSLLLLLVVAFGGAPPTLAAAPQHAPAAAVEQALLGAWSGRWASTEDRRHGSAEAIFTRGTEPGSLLAQVTFMDGAKTTTARREVALTDGRLRIELVSDGAIVLTREGDRRLSGTYYGPAQQFPSLRGSLELTRRQ